MSANKSRVEQFFLDQSCACKDFLSSERIKVVTVPNYVVLGQLTALRFIEWITENREGVVALPTGKTPEYFIKWFSYYRRNWTKECNSGILAKLGFTLPTAPSCKGLRFVQIDEYFPINPIHPRAFSSYIKRFYIDEFGFDPARTLLIDTYNLPEPLISGKCVVHNIEEAFGDEPVDLTLRYRQPQNDRDLLRKKILSLTDRFSQEYESKIREYGGIGFFLGGIGPDGHVGFNVRGSSHYSVTRLTKLNYESMAAGAGDLGGMESMRKRSVITIGLQTITFKDDAVVIIFAAGESKASVIARAVEREPHIDSPASALQKLPDARFFLTDGAASALSQRKRAIISRKKMVKESDIDALIIDSALADSVKLHEPEPLLKMSENSENLTTAIALGKKALPELVTDTAARLIQKLYKGIDIPGDQRFLHTAPHHDDIELAYFPLVHHLVRSSTNYNSFCYLTSGFTSVTNEYVASRLQDVVDIISSERLFRETSFDELSDSDLRYREIHGYLNAIAGRNEEMQNLFAAARIVRRLIIDSQSTTHEQLLSHTKELLKIVNDLYPGAMDPEPVQHLKSWIREWEAETAWAHFGISIDNIDHLGLKFYTGEIFPDDPQFARDIVPIVNILEKVEPTVVTLALDPEGSGPDTHYKCLIALRKALQAYAQTHDTKNLSVWGYRNVWSRFHLAEASVIVPVSLNSFAVLDNMFNNCFLSQRSASFPSYELDGTFSELARKIWTEQFQDTTKLLGKSIFYESRHPMLRRAYGVIYLKVMSFSEFMEETKGLTELEMGKKMLEER